MKIRLFSMLPLSLASGAFVVPFTSGCTTERIIHDHGDVVDGAIIPGASGGAGGGGGRTNTGGGGVGGASAASPLGKKCEVDTDCKEGLTCLQSKGNDLGPGGPAHGICSLDCASDSALCRNFDSRGVCVRYQGIGSFCFQGCTPGSTGQTLTQCQERFDMACQESTSNPNAGYCQPICGSDADCGTRKCDFETGLCADQVTGTLPIGSACDKDATDDPCIGFCIGVTGIADADVSNFGFCSGACALGDPTLGCGNDLSAAPKNLCIYASSSNAGVGDVGLCAQACDCNDDCLNKDMICDPFGSANLEQITQHAGACSVPYDSTGKPLPGIPCTRPPGTGGASATGGRSGAGGGSGAGGRTGTGGVADAGRD